MAQIALARPRPYAHGSERTAARGTARQRWVGAAGAGAGGIAALSGGVAALAMPRGPVTAGQALSLMAGSLIVGAAAGGAMRSRWAMLLAPAAHLAAFELGR